MGRSRTAALSAGKTGGSISSGAGDPGSTPTRSRFRRKAPRISTVSDCLELRQMVAQYFEQIQVAVGGQRP